MQQKKFAVRLLAVLCVYFLIVGAFYLIVKDDWEETPVATDCVSRSMIVGEMGLDDVLAQTFTPEMDVLSAIAVDACLIHPEGQAINIQIWDGEERLYEDTLPAYMFTQEDPEQLTTLELGEGITRRGHRLTLYLRTDGGVSFWYGNSVEAGRFTVGVTSSELLTLNGHPVDGQLRFTQSGVRWLHATRFVWPVGILLGAALAGVICYMEWCRRRGRASFLLILEDTVVRYRFLLKQLVVRDFKVKYKASVMGVLWSFLNPTLMAIVYYFVFSTIFRNNVDNFIVYLMSGIVFFNYFSESSSLGVLAIVGNAHLITKVYMPKYIYPLSKALSSAINLLISFVPLFAVIIFTGVPFRKSMFLLVLVVLFMIVFCTGMCMILSALNVFFRDVQFLWSILVMMWNFLTPIFYPESIIPAQFLGLYRLNPLYQFCTFSRTVILGGVSPTPEAYLGCLLASFGTLLIGMLVFRKSQNQFALYL